MCISFSLGSQQRLHGEEAGLQQQLGGDEVPGEFEWQRQHEMEQEEQRPADWAHKEARQEDYEREWEQQQQMEEAVQQKRQQVADMTQEVEHLGQLKSLQEEILHHKESLSEAREYFKSMAYEQGPDSEHDRESLKEQIGMMQERIQELEAERAEVLDARAQAEQTRGFGGSEDALPPVELAGEQAEAYQRLSRENQELREQQETLLQALETQEAFLGQLRDFEDSVKAMEHATARQQVCNSTTITN
jgi:chromosome segregation ATPase